MSAGGVSNEALLDLLKTTQKNLPWDGSFEVLLKHQTYEVINRWFAVDRVEYEGGTSVQRNVQIGESGNAEFVRLYQPTDPNVSDVQAQIDVPWRQVQTHYSIDRRELLRNRGAAGYIKLVKSRRVDAMMDLANLLEERAWQAPPSAADDLYPCGIPYWVVPITGAQVTAGTNGLQGANPSGFSDCGGIDASDDTYSRWRSYNDVWDAADGSISDDDVLKLHTMFRRLRFVSPITVSDVDQPAFRNLRCYANDTTLGSLEGYARDHHDNLGADVGRFAGATVFKNVPIIYVDYLDADTSNPFYMINHSYFRPFVLGGDYFRETGPMNDRRQHDVFSTFVDLSFNFICTNRQRAGGVISYVAAA